MADFNAEFQNPKTCRKYSLIMNSNTELLNNLGAFENMDSNVEGLLASSSADIMSFLENQQTQLPMAPNFSHHNNIHNSFHSDGPSYDPIYVNFLPSSQVPRREPKQAKEITDPQTDIFGISSGSIFGTAGTKNNYSYGGRKRKRNNEREVEKPREVVHVRAKRGQATDSHSLAERLRREKINEKLRCLQDLVPGCYKTMGMAVMLDVITTYVRSLQNQIEFLSMKLSAASLFYDFNSEMDAMETMQGTNGYEAQGMDQRIVGEGYGGGGGVAFSTNYFPSAAWAPSLT